MAAKRALCRQLRFGLILTCRCTQVAACSLVNPAYVTSTAPFVQLPLQPTAPMNRCDLPQVLAALQLLINVLGPDSPAAYPLLVPLLQHSLDAGSSRWGAGGGLEGGAGGRCRRRRVEGRRCGRRGCRGGGRHVGKARPKQEGGGAPQTRPCWALPRLPLDAA